MSDGRRSISLGTKKQRGLIALLLLNTGQPVRVDMLIEHLWPGGAPRDRRQLIYTMVSRLRGVLRHSGMRQVLNRVGNTYCLEVDPQAVDVHEFRDLVERSRVSARGERPAAAVADLQRAVGLWRGDPLAELEGAAAEHLRRQLSDRLYDARKLLATACLGAGQHLAVLDQLAGPILENDVDEELAALWAGALRAAGREGDARRYLAEFRRHFREELRVEPNLDLGTIQGAAATRSPIGIRPRQLPPSVSGFVGREDLLADLDRFAEAAEAEPGRPNVVVITGMPGIGKTTLAIHWAHRHADRFPDGNFFCDAAGFGNGSRAKPGEVLTRFLMALGMPADRVPADPEERQRRFNDMMDGRRMLILLDNVAESPQAQPLIPTAAGCLTVVTSRNRLSGLSIRQGGHHIVCPPLGEEESGLLLAQIVGPQRAEAEPSAMDRVAGVAEGMPLALRIVGEQIAERPRTRLAELVGDLQEHLLWAGAEGDDLGRVFSWSLKWLEPDAVMLFRRLSLHPGARIGLDAAASLAGLDFREAYRLLNALARAHLVEYDTARHYRLHDLLRQYAWRRCREEEKLEDIAAARVAVLTWYLLSAARAASILAPSLSAVPDLPAAGGPVLEFATEPDALDWYQSERQNLAEATRYAFANELYRFAWQIPAAIHDSLTRTGRYDDLIELDELAAKAARHDAHPFGEIAALGNLGHSLNATHQYGRSLDVLAVARDLAAKSGFADAESACLHNAATAWLGIRETGRAITAFHEVLSMSRHIGYRYGEAAILHRLGEAYRRDGTYALALDSYRAALRIREEMESLREQALTHHGLSACHLEAGDLEPAVEHCTYALTIYDRIDEVAGRCDALITWADIKLALKSPAAVSCARSAVAVCVESGDSHQVVHSLAVLAEALVAADRRDEVARTRAEAFEIAAELDGPDALDLVRRLLAAE